MRTRAEGGLIVVKGAMSGRLDEAFRRGGQERVRSLRFGGAPS